MESDPSGVNKLWRGLQFISQELQAAGDEKAAARVAGVSRFVSGPQTEFLGESLIVLRDVRQSFG